MKALKFTKRTKIITSVAVAAILVGTGSFSVYQHNVEAKAIQAEKVQKAKEADAKDASVAKDVITKLATTDRAHLNTLKDEAKKVKDPARKSNIEKSIKEATTRLDNADKAAAEKKAAEAKAAEAKKAQDAKNAEDARKAAEAKAAADQAAAEQAAAQKASEAQAATPAQSQATPAQQATVSEASAPTAAAATPAAPSYNIAGYSSVAIANSQNFIDNSRYSWISISDIPTAGGIALLGHADAAGTWVSGASVGDIVTVSGVAYRIYNKYTVVYNSAGEWDAIQSCASGEVSIITCTDASGQSDWVLRAKRV